MHNLVERTLTLRKRAHQSQQQTCGAGHCPSLAACRGPRQDDFRLMYRFAKIAVQRMMEVLLRLTLQYQRLALCILQAIFEVSRLAAWRI